jgi:hypothetical protein
MAEMHLRQVGNFQVALVLNVINFKRYDFLQPASFGSECVKTG